MNKKPFLVLADLGKPLPSSLGVYVAYDKDHAEQQAFQEWGWKYKYRKDFLAYELAPGPYVEMLG